MLNRRAEWLARARPKQITPSGDWKTWTLITGRGWGKTETGAQDLAWYCRTHPGAETAVAGRTESDTMRVCVNGPTGLMQVFHPSELLTPGRANGRLFLRLRNGSVIYVLSSERPDAFRGPNLDRLWADELAAWRHQDEWHTTIQPAVRGSRDRYRDEGPRTVVTTTPKPTDLIRELLTDQTSFVTRGATIENAANLPPGWIEHLERRLPHRIARQELYGELLDDVEGALWTYSSIAAARVDATDMATVGHPGYMAFWQRKVVALDPSDGTEEGDEQGLAVVGLGSNHELYVLDSQGLRVTPWDYLNHAVNVATEHAATLVIEKNHGSEYLVGLLEQVLRKRGVRIPYTVVTANPGRGKRTRAEPVAGLYERGKVHHIGEFPELETQMTSWTGKAGEKSPDRLDALVWALAEFTDYALGDTIEGEGAVVLSYEGMEDLELADDSRW